MATTLTRAGVTITPTAILGYSSSRDTGNVLHDVLGRADFDVTFGPAGLRALTLKFLFPTLTAALTAEQLHTSVGKIILADSDLPLVNMTYVPSGRIGVELDDESQKWFLVVDVQEVV